MTILSILDGKLTATHTDTGITHVIDTDAKLDAFIAANPAFFASSSVDFPHEYTTDPVTLALVTRLGRGL